MKNLIPTLCATVLLCVACGEPQPPIYTLNGDVIYIEDPTAPKGRLYGLGKTTHVTQYPVWEDFVSWDDGFGAMDDTDYFLMTRKGDSRLFNCFGKPLCDSAKVIGQPDFNQYGGTGFPSAYVKVKTVNGYYGIFNTWGGFEEFGPYEDIFPGTMGFAFKENGKWGLASYGRVRKLEYGYNAGEIRFTKDSKVLISPQFQKVLQVRYNRSTLKNRLQGWDNESDFTWYFYDGQKWNAFNGNGRRAAVREADLNRALKTKIQPGKPENKEWERRPYTQRRGTEEASIMCIYVP